MTNTNMNVALQQLAGALSGLGLMPEATSHDGEFRCASCNEVNILMVRPNRPNSPAAASVPAQPVHWPPVFSNAAPAVAPPSAMMMTEAGTFPIKTPEDQQWYAVWVGRRVGVFCNWERTVEPLVKGVPNWRAKKCADDKATQKLFDEKVDEGVVVVWVDPTSPPVAVPSSSP